MKTLVFISLLGCLLQNAFGQVSGRMTTRDGQPIPFANVLLLNSIDTSLVKGTLTDENGAYQLENIKAGSYFLRISSIGYQTWNSPIFVLTATLKGKDFGTLTIEEDTKQLAEVEIRAEKSLYQQDRDRTIVNVESSVLTKGSSALQVLERLPGVFIDRQNNSIALNGKNDVRIMVNGKLMRLPVEQVVTLLNGMSADNIEKVELLTTPSAQYDSEGNAGMINIVLKKSEGSGTTGSVSLTGGYGRGEKGAGTLNFSHSRGRVNTYGSYSFSHDKSYSEFFVEGTSNIPTMGGERYTDFWNQTQPVSTNHNASIGFDINRGKTTIGSSIAYNNSLVASTIFNRGEYSIKPDSFLLMLADINGRNRWTNALTNFYVEKEIKEGEKINIDIDYLSYKNENPSQVYTSFFDKEKKAVEPNGSSFSTRQRGSANTPIQVGVVKIDYTKQLNKNLKLEAGVKGTYTRSSSMSKIESLVNSSWISSARTSNNIDMSEGIGALYSSFQLQLNPSTNLIVGARYEYSDTQMAAEKEENNINRKFGKIFPSLFFSKKLNDKSDWQLSYTKRISRPSYTDLASFMTYADPIAVFTGNPFLKPTITNNLKVAYNYEGYSFSVLLSRDDFPIFRNQLTANLERDIMYVSPQNLQYQNYLTFQTNIPLKINKWWNMNYGLVGGWRQFKLSHTQEKLQKTYLAYSLNSTQTIQLPQNFFLEISGWYNSLQFDGSKKVNGFGVLNAGIKKELKNNRGSIQLSVSDLLKSMHVDLYFGHLTEEAFSTKNMVGYNGESQKSRIVKLSYVKSFGETKVKSQRQRGIGSGDERNRIRKD